jgi:hypothetical protein
MAPTPLKGRAIRCDARPELIYHRRITNLNCNYETFGASTQDLQGNFRMGLLSFGITDVNTCRLQLQRAIVRRTERAGQFITNLIVENCWSRRKWSYESAKGWIKRYAR